MKKRASYLIALLLSITLVSDASAHVALKYPNGGEIFTSGSQISLEWELVILHDTQNWDLYFSSDGGITWLAIQLNIPISQLSFQWVVPDRVTSEGRIRIVQDNNGLNYEAISADFVIKAVGTTIDRPGDLPERPQSLATYPNPFTSESVFEFGLAHAGFVTLEVFDVQGKRVAVLVDQDLASGSYRTTWNAAGLASGIYFYRIREGAYVESKKVLLVR